MNEIYVVCDSVLSTVRSEPKPRNVIDVEAQSHKNTRDFNFRLHGLHPAPAVTILETRDAESDALSLPSIFSIGKGIFDSIFGGR